MVIMGNNDISGSSIRGSQTTIETMLELIIGNTTTKLTKYIRS